MEHCIKYSRWTFPADKTMSGNLYLASSVLSTSLEPNTFTPVVECEDPSILDFERNAPLSYYVKPDQPMVFRVQSIERIAPKLYQISATSTLGLLMDGKHYGGIYTGETAEEIISSICGTVPFIIKSNLRNTKLYGWLPIAAPRDNLSQVLFALGAALKTDLDGVLRIETLWSGMSRAVGRERMYIESTTKYDSPVTGISVTEHKFTEGSDEATLFDGASQNGDIVEFREPIHSLTARGFQILDSGTNWAKLSDGNGVLTGKRYVHTTREVERRIHDAPSPNIKSVSDATLVSLVNSPSVADRMANYYQWRETVDIPMVYQGEQPGDRVAGYHPFDRMGVDYCLQSADITLSNTLKAQVKGVVGFSPVQFEEDDFTTEVEIITESGTWTAPEGTDEIIVVLIGGGQGGWSGREGSDGSLGMPGAGGKGGNGGHGGRISQASTNVTPGEQFEIVIGSGGPSTGYFAGMDLEPFGEGSWAWTDCHTTFGKFTSASGELNPDGYLEVITNTVFARDGATGTPGGRGGEEGEGRGAPWTGLEGHSVTDPDTGEVYSGGAGGRGFGIDSYLPIQITGGGGGGAALGGAGKNGGDAVRWTDVSKGYGGAGGTGATATKEPPAPHVAGTGGTGGPGGGGGGGAGRGWNGSSRTRATDGKGGDGARGGKGASGAVIIYRRTRIRKPSGAVVTADGRLLLDKFGRRMVV